MGEDATVLIVEDDRDVAASLAELLLLFGHSSRVAHTGEEGIERYASHRHSLVLMDFRLPGIDGIEAAQEILSLDPYAEIVILTGNSQSAELARARTNSVRGVLQKPVDPQEILRIVDRAKRGASVAPCSP